MPLRFPTLFDSLLTRLAAVTQIVLWSLALSLALTSDAAAQTAPPASAADTARASLPLDDVLRLYRESDRTNSAATPPPVPGVVDSIALSGRILDDALEVVAAIQLTVLDTDRWVTLPLFEESQELIFKPLPTLAGVAFATQDEQLVAIVDGSAKDSDRGAGKSARSHAFDIRFLVRAERQGDARRVLIDPADATATALELEFDEGLFALVGTDARRGAESYSVFPNSGHYEINWRRSAPPVEIADSRLRAPIEPVITSAHVSTVSTLEGEAHHRVLYDLRFEGSESLDITVPAGLALEKVFLNGRPLAFETADRLSLAVEPLRSGDRQATVELLLRRSRQEYHLSGDLLFTLPATSWPIHHFYATLHLPQVFAYRWSGGSLAPAQEPTNVTADFTYELPTPGERLSFQQPLVQGSQPTVRVAYDIDLEGQVFMGVTR